MTREELDRHNAAAVTKHSRALLDDARNPPQQLLDELRAFAEQYRLEWAEQYRGEQVPESVPPLTSMPAVVLEQPPKAPGAARTTTPRRPAARRKAT